MMGFFQEEYMQRCNILVMRDAAGTIQAFINQIPSFNMDEGNYDLLRYSKHAPGNSNDFLLMGFVRYLAEAGFTRLNLGLCPLAGIKKGKSDRTVIDTTLSFVYSNGDRFYSFSGLHRFKSKYEPVWQDRLIAYRGGVRGFTRSVNALNRTMNRSFKKHRINQFEK